MSKLGNRTISATKIAQNALGWKPDKTPHTKAIVLYSPSRSCILMKAAKPNKAVPGTPACNRAVETTTCNWRTLLCVKPCCPDCECLYPRPCPPPESWPKYLFRKAVWAAKISAACALIKASAEAGVWGFMDDTMKLRERLAQEMSEFFWVMGPNKTTNEERYEMERFKYNWKSAYNYFVMRLARDLINGSRFLSEFIQEYLASLFEHQAEDTEGPDGGPEPEEEEEEKPLVCPKKKKSKEIPVIDPCRRIDQLPTLTLD